MTDYLTSLAWVDALACKCHSIKCTGCRLTHIYAKVITFFILVFCNKNFHRCSSFLHTLILNISDKLYKNY